MAVTESTTLNYSDVFYSFFTNNDSICHDKAKSHYLVYVNSGEMLPAIDKAFFPNDGNIIIYMSQFSYFQKRL